MICGIVWGYFNMQKKKMGGRRSKKRRHKDYDVNSRDYALGRDESGVGRDDDANAGWW